MWLYLDETRNIIRWADYQFAEDAIESDRELYQFPSGKVAFRDEVTMEQIREAEEQARLEAYREYVLHEIRRRLDATDYKCLKFVDGKLSEKEYAVVREERDALREAYNNVEAADSIAAIKAIAEPYSIK